MQTLKSNIWEMILKAARGKFARKGFLKTSMRDIADAAGMGVGNVYNYFAGKDELFQAVVRPVTDEFKRLLEKHHGQSGRDALEMFSEAYFWDCVNEYVQLIDKYRTLMRILLFLAQGSSLETFREQFTNRATEQVKAWFADNKQKHPEINVAVSDFFIHLHTVWMFTLFEEMLMHNIQRQEIGRIVEEYVRFEIQGWKNIMNIYETEV
nr:TetR/AcrR family transcriptional regulator [Prevotella sp.]